jgi:hypothetical protein
VRFGEAAKAVGQGLAILLLNFAAATAAIFAYSLVIAPGRDQAFYAARAPVIAGWVAPAAGALMFLGLGLWLRRRRSRAEAVWSVVRAWIAYVILDLASGLALGSGASMLSGLMLFSVLAALAGGLAGCFIRGPAHGSAEKVSA